MFGSLGRGQIYKNVNEKTKKQVMHGPAKTTVDQGPRGALNKMIAADSSKGSSSSGQASTSTSNTDSTKKTTRAVEDE